MFATLSRRGLGDEENLTPQPRLAQAAALAHWGGRNP
jgi:hypothetical protein